MLRAKTRLEAEELCRYVLDDNLCGRPLGSDRHAVIRNGPPFRHSSAIILCRCESGIIGVVIHSYLDVAMEMYESVDLSINFLREMGEDVLSHEFFEGLPCEA